MDCINFKSISFSNLGMQVGLAGDNRYLFMPHSAGIYVALVMKDAKCVEEEQSEMI